MALQENSKSTLADSEGGRAPERGEQAVKRLTFLESRIHDKIDAYENYRFTLLEARALNIFFDLAQEYSDVFDLYALCVVVPKVFFQKRTTLYLLSPEGGLDWRADSDVGSGHKPEDYECPLLVMEPTVVEGRYHIPIKGNKDLLAQLSFTPKEGVIGLMVVAPGENLSDHEKLFFEKYANRIGFQLHNRLISLKNREHLQFIKSLVDDIGHNVIVPNMYFKLFYRRLESKILVLRDIGREFQEFTGTCQVEEDKKETCKRLKRELDYTYESLMEQFKEIYRHYEQTSLFLETLLRRGHFEKGHYVLEKQAVNIRDQVIVPQVERYRGRLEERGIEITPPEQADVSNDLTTVADVGLLSQVFANLFSNAVKYTRENNDNGRKHVGYDCSLLPNYFGPGKPGVRCSVTTTGPKLTPEEAGHLYNEGFRGSNVSGEYGTGHGLHFIREVVTLHGGQVGYTPVNEGNEFFFILPATRPDGAAADADG